MDADLLEKIAAISKSRNGTQTLEVFNTAVYFAPGAIRIGIFSPLISDRSDLAEAISMLERLSLVQGCGENSFSIKENVRTKYRNFLCYIGEEENTLKRAVLFLTLAKDSDYPHSLSVYAEAKSYPRVLRKMDSLLASIVLAMTGCGKFHEAVSFGRECIEALETTVGERVFHLQCAVGLALVKVNEKAAAVKLLAMVYRESCLFSSAFEIRKAMQMLAGVMFSDTSNPNQEDLLFRSIVFGDSDISDDWDLNKWIFYSILMFQFHTTERAIAILHDVIRCGLPVNADAVYDAMEFYAHYLTDDSEFSRAMELLEIVYRKREEELGVLNERTVTVKMRMGKVFAKKGDLERSMKLYEEIVKQAKRVDKLNEELLYAMEEMVQISIRMEDFAKALQLSQNLTDRLLASSNFILVRDRYFKCRKKRSEIYLALNKPQKAIEVLRDLLEKHKYDFDDGELEELRSEIRSIENLKSFDAPAGTLHSHAREGDLKGVLSLLAAGSEVDERASGMTPLHFAAAFDQVEAAKLLLEKGAKHDARDHQGSTTPLDVAKGAPIKGLLGSVRSLFAAAKVGDGDRVVDHAAILAARDDTGCTPLHWAALRGHGRVVRTLLELGADPTLVSDRGNSPLHIAASKGWGAIVDALLNAGAALEGRTGAGGNTPLHAAAERGHAEVVKALLARGAQCFPENTAGKTPLQLSTDWDCKNILELVEGLFRDASEGNAGAVCRKLRCLEREDCGAVSGARDKEGRKLVQAAVKHGHLEVAKKLLKLLKYD